jgi:hypothetical protein
VFGSGTLVIILCVPDETETVEVDAEVTGIIGSGATAFPELVLAEGGGGGGGKIPVIVELADDTGDGNVKEEEEATFEPVVSGILEWLGGVELEVMCGIEEFVRGTPGAVPLGAIPVPLMRRVLPTVPFNVVLPAREWAGSHGSSFEARFLRFEGGPSYLFLGSATPKAIQEFWSR